VWHFAPKSKILWIVSGLWRRSTERLDWPLAFNSENRRVRRLPNGNRAGGVASSRTLSSTFDFADDETLSKPSSSNPASSASGRLYVVSAPSGAGKTSLVKALMEREPRIRFSVSYTTRKPRQTEIPGRDYHFVSPERFADMVQHDEFLEHARVFDNEYGTGIRAVQEALSIGEQLLLEIDWQGARQVRARLPEAVSIFILPPSRAALEERLKTRSTDSEVVIQRRLEDAAEDISHWAEFDYVVINDRFEQALEDLLAVVAGRGGTLLAVRPEVARLAAELLAAA
jgi:guanylate kinase